MSAEDVWSRICSYNGDAAKKILKAYGNDPELVIATLKKRGSAENAKYHGHASGKSGDGEEPGAAALRKQAIAFLVKNAPAKEEKKEEKKPKANIEKKAASVKSTDGLLKIISDGSDFSRIKASLDEADPGWEKNRRVKAEFDRAKKAKKDAQKNKLKKR